VLRRRGMEARKIKAGQGHGLYLADQACLGRETKVLRMGLRR